MKKSLLVILSLLVCLGALSGCGKAQTVSFSVTEEQLQSICELTTLECFFKNVAKSNKTKENFLQKDREFWVEYTGVVRVGIDFEKVTLQEDGNKLIITLPEAEVFGIESDVSSHTIIKEAGNIFSQKVSAEDVNEVKRMAQKDMEDAATNNKTILTSARNKAKTIIADYIAQMDELAGTSHTIIWRYSDNEVDNTPTTDLVSDDLRLIS